MPNVWQGQHKEDIKNLSAKDRLIIEANAYESLQKQIKALNDGLDGIIELYFTYKNRGDDYAAQNYIYVSSGLIMAYLLSRQKNTLLRMNPEAGLAPESNLSAFLQTSFEKLKIIWDKALANNDVYIIRKYLREVQGIVRVSLLVDHLNNSYENPAFFTAYYNFRQLIKDSTKAKSVDALFEIASVLDQISEVAVTKTLQADPLESILDDLQAMCVATLASDEMSVVNHNVIKNMLTICNRILTQEEIGDYRLRKMQEVVPLCISFSILGIKDMSLTDIAIANFGDNIFAMATHNMDEPPTQAQIDKIIQTSSFTISLLEALAKIANGRRYQTQSINRSIIIMANTLIKILNDNPATPQQTAEIQRILNSLASLPNSFPEPDKTESLNDANNFMDKLVQSAIIAIQANQIDVATRIFDSIYDYLHKMLTDANSKVSIHEILRAVNRAKLIGAAARKLRRQNLQRHVAEKTREFESEYLAKILP
ncbi:MAG: hypothetical protein WDN66_05785 [Candidatus Saccharibacteria bacterium]